MRIEAQIPTAYHKYLLAIELILHCALLFINE